MLALVIVVVSVLCVLLGRWQWHRHEDRRERANVAETALAQAPVPAAELLSAADVGAAGIEFRTVTMSGTYDAEHQLLWRNPRGRSGFSVVTPLVPQQGPALLVERGWTPLSTTDANAPAADVTPPTGPIEVDLRVRSDQPLDDRTAPTGQVYVINSDQIGDELPYALFPGYGELIDQDPSPDDALELPETQTPSLGPHLLYAYQWWFFAILALVGFALLLRREAAEASVTRSVTDDSQPSPSP